MRDKRAVFHGIWAVVCHYISIGKRQRQNGDTRGWIHGTRMGTQRIPPFASSGPYLSVVLLSVMSQIKRAFLRPEFRPDGGWNVKTLRRRRR